MLSLVLEQTWSLLWLWAHDVRSYQANDAIVISHWHRTIWCSILMQSLYVMSAINCSIASGIAEVGTDWSASLGSDIKMEDVGVTPFDPKSYWVIDWRYFLPTILIGRSVVHADPTLQVLHAFYSLQIHRYMASRDHIFSSVVVRWLQNVFIVAIPAVWTIDPLSSISQSLHLLSLIYLLHLLMSGPNDFLKHISDDEKSL